MCIKVQTKISSNGSYVLCPAECDLRVAQVKEAARQYRVYYTRAGDDDDEDYLIDHSIIMYLLNPKGEFVTFYGKNYTAEQLQASLKGFLS